MYNVVVTQFPYALGYVPDELKTQETCNEAIHKNLTVLFLVPYRFEIEDVSIKAFEEDLGLLEDVPDNLKTQGMCEEAVEQNPWQLYNVPDRFKTKRMYNRAVEESPRLLQFVPDWYVAQQQIKLWHDDHEHCDDDELIEWYKDYKNRKAQKLKIKHELAPITWHPSKYWDWCMSEDKKKETEKLPA